MPGDVTRALSVGFCGKLPAQGDFVRSGLPRDFVDPWDNWLSEVMAVTRLEAGNAWLPAFLQAPVWRFILPPGMCGAGAVIGLIMPSVDRVGRYFPLTFAAVARYHGFLRDPSADAWLNACEDAGRAALEQDVSPASIAGVLGVPDQGITTSFVTTAEWWTDGSQCMPATGMTLESLPDAEVFRAMLGIIVPDKDSK